MVAMVRAGCLPEVEGILLVKQVAGILVMKSGGDGDRAGVGL